MAVTTYSAITGIPPFSYSASSITVPSASTFGWSDAFFTRDAAAVIAQKNGTTAQEFRVYGTTTGTKYLGLAHSGSGGVVTAKGVGSILAFALEGGTAWYINAANSSTPLRLIADGNYGFSHGTSALETNATEGFFHLQSCAGAPTGVPASIPTGQIPMIFDTTNSRLYLYHGEAWHYIAQTA